jgi:phage/plasmid-like protein (TIGR03299 family)
VLYRGDTQAPLSVVSDGYKIVQPREVIEFFRDLVEAGDMRLHTAGSLYGGERIWALAKLAEDFRLMGQDQIGGYLLLATSCDGTFSTTGQFTSVRVVCNNTLRMSLSGDHQGRVKVPHSRRFNAEAVKAQLGLGKVAFAEFAEVAERLAARKVTRSEAVQWLIDTFGDPEKAVDEQEKGAAQLMKKVWDACRKSPGATMRSADGTAWGLVNGATYYFDHERNTRTDDSRFDRAQFGDGAAAKQRALENALKLAA